MLLPGSNYRMKETHPMARDKFEILLSAVAENVIELPDSLTIADMRGIAYQMNQRQASVLVEAIVVGRIERMPAWPK